MFVLMEAHVNPPLIYALGDNIIFSDKTIQHISFQHTWQPISSSLSLLSTGMTTSYGPYCVTVAMIGMLMQLTPIILKLLSVINMNNIPQSVSIPRLRLGY